ncbi:hypothetical protein NDU88_005542 [Pleurodeles waltl]|uniref:Uncharacterized protein n=1 Tax=Pleurodeles waltl TaxID=8319 RepID=A0AAV7RLR4_PLEWA|nr:hypothetical protein NDU88_005542 [Pleurodeles waltl]
MDNYAIAKETSSSLGQDSATLSASEPLLGAIMAAISDFKSTLKPKLDTVTADISLLCADLQKMVDKMSTMESDIQTLRSTSKSLEVRTLTAQHETMAARPEDQEGRSRRNCSRVVGVPEGAEGASVDLFLEDIILKTLCPKRLSNFFMVERAHRTLGLSPRPGAPPRTIIARTFNHRDREAILQAAHTHCYPHNKNLIIRIFSDYSIQVQKQRRSLDEVKKVLHIKELKYMMLFPARLQVLAEGKSWYFTSPADA